LTRSDDGLIGMARILICDPIREKALEIMGRKHEVVNLPGVSRTELLERIGEFDAVVVRARTKMDSEVISRGDRLKVIARAGVGTDNIDVAAATERGILVVNSPDPSISSVAEHAFALLLSVCRNVARAHASVVKGRWRKSDFVGTEISGKTLGIVGLGRIGGRVASIAKGFGLELLATDPYASVAYAERLGVKLVSLEDLLRRSHFISLHVPLTDSTRGLIGREEFQLMRPEAIIINTSRSGVIDSKALLEALRRKRIKGAGLDVFDSSDAEKLSMFPNVVLTPHIGASTREAQSQIAEMVAEEVLDALEGRPTRNPVNMPHIDRKALDALRPYLDLTDRMVKILFLFMSGSPRALSMSLSGDASEIENADYLLRDFVLGVLSPFHDVNVVNAMSAAERMGIKTEIARGRGRGSYTSTIELRAEGDRVCTVKGALLDSNKPRIVGLQGYELEFVPRGHLLITEHRDIPGMVGTVGTKLGRAGINIATMQLARRGAGEEAIMVISTDKAVPAELVKAIGGLEGMLMVESIDL